MFLVVNSKRLVSKPPVVPRKKLSGTATIFQGTAELAVKKSVDLSSEEEDEKEEEEEVDEEEEEEEEDGKL